MRALFLLPAFALAGPGLAQQPGVPAPEAAQAAPTRNVDDIPVNQLIVYGDDACPSNSEEITICVRLTEDDRYRIPENLRNDPNDPRNQSWTNRAIELSYVGRTGIGSCTPVGPGGTSGCFNQIVQQARAERAGAPNVNWERLIEQARQERLGQIDAAARAEEEAENAPD
jgi:hypothetical protein